MRALGLLLLAPSLWASPDCIPTMQRRLDALDDRLRRKQAYPVQLNADGLTLTLNGEINHAMRAQFDAIPPSAKKRIRTLVVDSPGGQVVEAAPIAQWVFDAGNLEDVVVPKDGICASACTEILRCAWNRRVDTSALLLFHPAHMSGQGQNPLADAVGNGLAAGVTALQEVGACAQTLQSEGARRLSRKILAGEEFCVTGPELQKDFPAYADVLDVAPYEAARAAKAGRTPPPYRAASKGVGLLDQGQGPGLLDQAGPPAAAAKRAPSKTGSTDRGLLDGVPENGPQRVEFHPQAKGFKFKPSANPAGTPTASPRGPGLLDQPEPGASGLLDQTDPGAPAAAAGRSPGSAPSRPKDNGLLDGVPTTPGVQVINP